MLILQKIDMKTFLWKSYYLLELIQEVCLKAR